MRDSLFAVGVALLAFAGGFFLAGCVAVPAHVTVYSPDRVALAHVDTAKGEVVLTPEAWRILMTMGRR